jgi:RNA-directed DNA polymerase
MDKNLIPRRGRLGERARHRETRGCQEAATYMRRVCGEGLCPYPGRPGGRPRGNPRREARLSRQESAEAIVPERGRAEHRIRGALVSSKDVQRQQKTPNGAYRQEAAVKPQEPAGGPSTPTVRPSTTPHEGQAYGLMEQVVARDNMRAALRRVEQNRGAPGVDRVTTEELGELLRREWPKVREALLGDAYMPTPVRRVEIPKPGGGVRLLGIPTVLDRLIQQALLQVLTPIFDPTFSSSSYGFRPGRRAHDAVRRARQYVEEGYDWVVDIDIEKFFDRVNHDILMAKVARTVQDKRVLRLIRRYLQAGVMVNGVAMETEEGTPQGGPLSPLLANIMLHDLDMELEHRGHRFVRYADDCNIYVRTERAGQRVMTSVTDFLQKRLKLRINQDKSAVDRPQRRKLLGFSYQKHKGQVRIRLSNKSRDRFRVKVRELTRRTRSENLERRIQRLNSYLLGWVGYYSLADTPSVFAELDSWVRRRLRACLWAQWKRVRTRIRELRKLGLPDGAVMKLANTRKGPWRIAKVLNSGLGTLYWRNLGLLSLADRYAQLRMA